MRLFLLLSLAVVASAQGPYDYSEVLGKSLLFYEAQRSGPLPADNRIDWRADSTLDDNPLGGYFDGMLHILALLLDMFQFHFISSIAAGDHVKFGFPMAGAMTQVAWGGISFQAGFEAAGQMDYLKSTLKWGTDYFIAAHSSANEFIGQVGDGYADHGVWTRPEDLNMARPSFSMTCGSDLAGETAAALAASSVVYRNMGDEALADEALSHARELFDFANNCRDVYTNQIPAADFYKYAKLFLKC